MKPLSPRTVLAKVAEALPRERLKNVIIIGSLAVAYHYFKDDEGDVRTKDVDCLLAPNSEMAVAGSDMTVRLLEQGWQPRRIGGFGEPQAEPEPRQTLSAIRLTPPGHEDWFVELIGVPESEYDTGKNWVPVEVGDGYYGLPSFEFLSLAAFRPMDTEYGIRCARPEMMALANLLSHPKIGPEYMTTEYEGRAIRRSNKDLGRVLAIARLDRDPDMAGWGDSMLEGLKAAFPTRYPDLAQRTGSGLRELLASDDDLEEAQHILNTGLLARNKVGMEQLRATGRRFLQDVIEPLERSCP